MINKKYYPFKRNNYFYGKLLTVKDFEDEQRYMNDKRRIHNFLTAGAGIVSGLSVVEINEKTISIESGLALDYMGREIVVEESITKKLNVIDGFETLVHMDNIYLCLCYDEKKEEAVHSVVGEDSKGGEKNDYSRVKEGYRIFLTDVVNDEKLLTVDFLKEVKEVIYHHNGLKITQIIPRYGRSGEKIELKVIIEKINLPRMITVDYSYILANIKTQEKENVLKIHYQDEDTTSCKKVQLLYELAVDNTNETKGYIEIEADGKILIGTINDTIDKTEEVVIDISSEHIMDRIVKRQLSRHFEDILTVGADNCIYLAKMRLVRHDNEYFIDSFETLPFQQYVLSNAMLSMLLRNQRIPVENKPIYIDRAQVEPSGNNETQKYIAQGEETIEVDIHSKNKSYFSEEIAHGLGKGDVMITTAVEDISDNSIFDMKKSIFGDVSVFQGSYFEPAMADVATGIISYTDRGTFRIGIRFKENISVSAVIVKWWAVKNELHIDNSATEINQVEIRIEPDTISIAPREKCKFEAVITGTDNKECRWNVTDHNGGLIDINGVYDAPTQEGVYEITAESVKYPNKRATAFIVVKEK